ncbi:Shedu immune nuclease family protein [Mesorhizobium sp. LjNodule214]|uniref:Shedu immune nuclease family protein n=1 Tax=Mesorhizobium sp. LjNodule214 TaxID=3342252 RepID=UPI003ECEC290
METQFAAKATEPQWQGLFKANPFILDMAFNVPVLLLQGQAHVGGKVLDGSGEKIADFLFTNQLTDNIAVLEIRTPGMELISKRQYRGGVFAPSSELVGAVAQILDQVNKLQSDIYRLKVHNPQHKLESYGIKGVLLAGIIPDAERKRAFELYRNALSGLSIITFDELLAKLKSLRELLTAKQA